MNMFLNRLKWRLQNLRGFWDYFWVICVVLNAVMLVSNLMAFNLLGAGLSGLFLYACLRGLV